MLNGDDRVGYPQRKVVVRMHSLSGLRLQNVAEGFEAVRHIVHQQGPGRVHNVDAVRPIRFHQPGLARQLRGRRQKPGDVQSDFPRVLDVLAGNIGFGAVRRDPHRLDTRFDRGIQILNRPDAGYQKRGHLGPADRPSRGADPFHIGMRTHSVVEAGPGQSIAVGDLDGVDTGVIQRLRNLCDLLQRISMADGMHSVSQGYVLDV